MDHGAVNLRQGDQAGRRRQRRSTTRRAIFRHRVRRISWLPGPQLRMHRAHPRPRHRARKSHGRCRAVRSRLAAAMKGDLRHVRNPGGFGGGGRHEGQRLEQSAHLRGGSAVPPRHADRALRRICLHQLCRPRGQAHAARNSPWPRGPVNRHTAMPCRPRPGPRNRHGPTDRFARIGQDVGKGDGRPPPAGFRQSRLCLAIAIVQHQRTAAFGATIRAISSASAVAAGEIS